MLCVKSTPNVNQLDECLKEIVEKVHFSHWFIVYIFREPIDEAHGHDLLYFGKRRAYSKKIPIKLSYCNIFRTDHGPDLSLR